MPDSFELIEVILIIGIFQGIFLFFTILRITPTNKKANIILSLLIGIATIMLLGRFMFISFFSSLVFQWSLLFDSFIFLLGPLFYMYVRRMLFKEGRNFSLQNYHYFPFIIMVCVSFIYIALFTPQEYFEAYEKGQLALTCHIVLIAGIISNAYYLLASFKLLRIYKKEEKEVLSYKQSPIKFLLIFHAILSLFLGAKIFTYVSYAVFHHPFEYLGYDIIWMIVPILIYTIGYFSLKQPELFRLQTAKEAKVAKRRDRLSEDDSKRLSIKLNKLMSSEELFLKNDITLKEIADTLNASVNEISWLLNTVYGKSFYDYINEFRIKKFINKIENGEHHKQTILALSFDAGFNSKSTFNNAFKKYVGCTPSDYIKGHESQEVAPSLPLD